MVQTSSASRRRDLWRLIWQIVTGNGLLVILLLAAAAGSLATAWLPQAPTADPQAYARWFSETQARFGKAVQTMQALGLFGIARSFGFRALLALLAATLLLRLVERGDRLLSGAARWKWVELFPLLAHGGGLLLLTGLLITHLWSWRVEGLIVQSGEQLPVPGTESWIALQEDASRVTHSPGIVVSIEALGPGVRVSAADGAGNALAIGQAAEADLHTELTLALAKDQHFAIPDAQLIVQLTPQSGHPAGAQTPVRVQVYRYPPVQLETETVVTGDAELGIDDVTLNLVSQPYAQVTATFNPGMSPTGIGIALAIAGLVGSVVRSAHKPRTDEED
ncbi:MAG: hypothetical protein JW918_07510 [Anaerolineae bacterium]|nr:hypothetical protein [Anaerolineae bacterium]